MKAVRAYTCIDPDEERKIIVVSDDGEHYPFSIRLVDFCYIGEDMSPYDPAPDDWIVSCTNIQPVELPDKEEVQHDYRLHGDSMQEIYPPDYAEWLEKQEPTEEDKERMAEMLSPEYDRESF